MKSRIGVRNYLFTIVFFVTFLFCLILLYLQTKEIKVKEYELNQSNFVKEVAAKGVNSYWNVLSYIENKEYLKIKYIDTSVANKGYICIDLEFKGSMQLLEYFLESLKADEVFKKINSIRVKEEGKDASFAEINIEFYI